MKLIDKIGCVIFASGLGLRGGTFLLEKRIGGSGANGYHTDTEYFVRFVGSDVYNEASKTVWYVSYIGSLATAILLGLSCVFIFYLWVRYACIPMWRKSGWNFFGGFFGD